MGRASRRKRETARLNRIAKETVMPEDVIIHCANPDCDAVFTDQSPMEPCPVHGFHDPYFECPNCGLTQTVDPHVLAEGGDAAGIPVERRSDQVGEEAHRAAVVARTMTLLHEQSVEDGMVIDAIDCDGETPVLSVTGRGLLNTLCLLGHVIDSLPDDDAGRGYMEKAGVALTNLYERLDGVDDDMVAAHIRNDH